MSWNEPGDNKKDPWSGREPSQTPPDLDEVFQNLQEKMRGLFGGAGSGGGQDPFRVVGLVAGVGLGLWALTGVYLVDEGSRGVETRFGAYTDTTMPGLHWHFPAPVEQVEVVNIEQQRFMEIGYRSGGRQNSFGSVPKEALMLTQDENIIDIRLAVQYQIKDAQAYLFNVSDPDSTLKQVIESAQRAVIGKNTMDFILTEGRGQVASKIKVAIQETLDEYQIGIRVSNVNLVDAQPPEEVQAAFEDAIKAREDEQRLKNEAEAYANEVVPRARGSAARLLEQSEAYKQEAIARAQGEASRFQKLRTEFEKAPEVTRERMYIDTMQEVLSQTGTVLVDTQSSNNLLYLPLDQLQKGAVPAPSNQGYESPGATSPSQKLQSPPQSVTRSSNKRGRGRGQ